MRSTGVAPNEGSTWRAKPTRMASVSAAPIEAIHGTPSAIRANGRASAATAQGSGQSAIPDGTTIQTVERQPCTESHNAEVIFVGDYTEGTTYPISLTLDRFIESVCVPAFETYLGRSFDSDPELSIGYFYPSRDGWDDGDRTITCYVAQPDESPMTESLKG